MILTITANPSIDIQYPIDSFATKTVNRSPETHKTAGGKGINVTKVIHYAGYDVLATGFLGGANGEWIKKQLHKQSISEQFFPIEGETRNCIAIIHDGKQTEILEAGPHVENVAQQMFLHEYTKILSSNISVVVASGSLPKGCDAHYYGRMIQLADEFGCKFLLDTSGNVLKESIQYKPYMIKPNEEELEQLVGKKIHSEEDTIDAMTEIHQQGIPLIVVSRGKNGALAMYENRIFKVTIPTVTVVNPVGSGDSTVAGIAIGLQEKWPIEKTLRYACTLGTANAVEKETGFVRKETIEQIFSETSVEELNFTKS